MGEGGWEEGFYLYFDIALETDGANPKLKIKSLSKLLAMMQENDLCNIYRIRNLAMQKSISADEA